MSEIERAHAQDVREADDRWIAKVDAKVPRWRVVWDNGAGACDTFSVWFESEEDAEAYGREWADASNLRDFGTTDPDGDCYTYDVVKEGSK